MSARRSFGRALVGVTVGSLGLAITLALNGSTKGNSEPLPGPVTVREATLLSDAEHAMERDCMTGKGFRYWITQGSPVPDSREFPYVVDDVVWARKHGYGSDIDRRVDALRRSDPNTRYLQGLPPQRRKAAIEALNGDDRRGTLEVRLPSGMIMGRSANGCTADAERALYGDLRAWFQAKEITANLDGLRHLRVMGDPRYVAQMRLMLDCMHAHGYEFNDLGQARSTYLNPDEPQKRAAEVKTAVTEANCASSTGTSALATQLDRKYGEEISRKYQSVYTTRYRLEHKALTRARAVLKAR